MGPLDGLTVVDFSTLLPGPMASLVLAEAGATVIKIERPQTGDDMRTYQPRLGEDSVNFVMLNRGKRSISIDLKRPDARDKLKPLIERADVLIEQFRPGVMSRLGFGFDEVRDINPKLIYCSISGWGQTGPKSNIAAHDLNYVAETGMLGLSTGADGAPVLPPMLAADIAGGAFPAVMNIMFALRERDRTGRGVHLDISMADNLFAFNYWGIGSGLSGAGWPKPGGELVTGGSPRYHIYRTRDGRYLAAAPIEDKFWENFTRIIELPAEFKDPTSDTGVAIAAVAERIVSRTASEWKALFDGQDVCCSIVATLEEAVKDPHVAARGLFEHTVGSSDGRLSALPVPIASVFRTSASHRPSPALGASNELLES
ncbi:CoA transferase [Paraburkholderia dipogonis]|uniref:CoA transferase n=1 Tax=Paraburkholderia dipogonis TaxID=1211383 RepID=A0A4Y8MWR4_9BURK|nr:CaiB/BaiF CoA-transferase family protein [Paraburkholderia dipogonis]TFE41986.1 CoA transferase [Paraburkholderia dipogonis]